MTACKDAVFRLPGLTILWSALGCFHVPQDQTIGRPLLEDASPQAGYRASSQTIGGADQTFNSSAVVRASVVAAGRQNPDLPAPPGNPGHADSADGGNDPAIEPLRNLYRRAVDRYAAIDSYIVRLRRREQVNGKDKPEEVMLVKFRKQPWSIYFKWLGAEGNGREVIYVRGQYENKIQTLLAAGDMPFAPAGKRIAISPDNPLARASSRHSINEAGIGLLIDSFGILVRTGEGKRSQTATLTYLGLLQRPEFPSKCEAAEQIVLPGVEPQLPRGGRRLWAFETQSGLPALVITQDETGHEVEFYCYDRFQFPVRLDDNDFNPDKLWPRSKLAGH